LAGQIIEGHPINNWYGALARSLWGRDSRLTTESDTILMSTHISADSRHSIIRVPVAIRKQRYPVLFRVLFISFRILIIQLNSTVVHRKWPMDKICRSPIDRPYYNSSHFSELSSENSVWIYLFCSVVCQKEKISI
jgi:hypothetical protein